MGEGRTRIKAQKPVCEAAVKLAGCDGVAPGYGVNEKRRTGFPIRRLQSERVAQSLP